MGSREDSTICITPLARERAYYTLVSGDTFVSETSVQLSPGGTEASSRPTPMLCHRVNPLAILTLRGCFPRAKLTPVLSHRFMGANGVLCVETVGRIRRL